jgi:hypothetical protein
MAKSLNQKKQTELKRIIQNLSVLHKNRSKLQSLMRGGASILVKIAVSLVVAFLTDSMNGSGEDDESDKGDEDEKDVFEVLDGFEESDFDELDIITNDIDLSDIDLEDLEAARIELDTLTKQIK